MKQNKIIFMCILFLIFEKIVLKFIFRGKKIKKKYIFILNLVIAILLTLSGCEFNNNQSKHKNEIERSKINFETNTSNNIESENTANTDNNINDNNNNSPDNNLSNNQISKEDLQITRYRDRSWTF